MRLFYAGDIPDDQKACLSEAQEKLKAAKANVRWVRPENFHLTFYFLGEVKQSRLQDLKELGEEVCRLYGSFNVCFKELGAFPPKGTPHVIWAGIDEGKSQLAMLAQALESRLEKSGFIKERDKFQPHMTLGRVKGSEGIKDLLHLMGAELPAFQSWKFSSFSLKESQLTKSGSSYKDIFLFPLGKKIKPAS